MASQVSVNNVQIPGQELLPLYPPPLSRNQSSSFLFPYVFTKCLFSVSQSASVLNTFFHQILPITLPVGFISFKTRFRAVMQPLRPCGGAKIQSRSFWLPSPTLSTVSGSFQLLFPACWPSRRCFLFPTPLKILARAYSAHKSKGQPFLRDRGGAPIGSPLSLPTSASKELWTLTKALIKHMEFFRKAYF